MKKYRVFMLLMLLFMGSAHSRMMFDTEQPTYKTFYGKLYVLPWSEWKHITDLEDLTDHEVKPNQWGQIIRTGNAKDAAALLWALNRFLNEDQLWPFIEMGLMRTPSSNDQPLRSVAQNAYIIWKHQKPDDALFIRSHPVYRKNLIHDVLWSGLFSRKGDVFSDVFQAMDFLRTPHSEAEVLKYEHTTKTEQAIALIAQHQKTEDLKIWMNDENFTIALASWVALSKQTPNEVALQITENASWLNGKISFTYGSGCFRNTGHLTPFAAALDLFSDYLTTDQLKQVMSDVQGVIDPQGLQHLRVDSPQMKQALAQFPSWHPNIQSMAAADQGHVPTDLSDEDQLTMHLLYYGFDSNGLKLALNQLETADLNQAMWLSLEAVRDNSPNSRTFFDHMSQSDVYKTHASQIAQNLLTEVDIWPQDWSKQHADLIKAFQSAEYIDIDNSDKPLAYHIYH